MPLQIVRDDITRIEADAIVNATNEYLIPGGTGVDASIHQAAGPGLAAELAQTAFCDTGCVLVTGAHNISQCKIIIHAVPPVFYGGKRGEREALESCYRKAMEAAEEYSCDSVAIPLLASGANGYPREKAYSIATSVIRDYFISNDSDLMVYLVLFDAKSIGLSKRAGDVTDDRIDDGYVAAKKNELRYGSPPGIRYSIQSGPEPGRRRYDSFLSEKGESLSGFHADYSVCEELSMPAEVYSSASMMGVPSEPAPVSTTKAENYRAQDLSFGDMCEWWISVKGMTKGEFYARSNLSRATFGNIKNKPGSIPKVSSALACVIGLKLNRDQADDLLMRAGLALTVHNPIMKAVIPYITAGNYDIDEINGVLFDSDLAVLGTNV